MWAIVVAVALAFLYAVRGILLPFVLAFVIAALLEPTITKLRKRGYSRGCSVTFVFGVFFVVITALIIRAAPIVTDQISGFSQKLQALSKQLTEADRAHNAFVAWNPTNRARPPGAASRVDRFLERYRDPIERLGLPANRKALVQQYVEPYREQAARAIQGFFAGFLGIVGTAASQVFLLLFTPVFVLILLIDMERLRVRSATWIPPSIRRETLAILREIGDVFIRYLRGISMAVGCFIVLQATVLTVLGAPYSVLLAILFGALYLIPYLGITMSLLCLFLATGLSGATGNWMLNLGDPWAFAAAISLVFFVVGELYDIFVTPQLMGRAIGLHPLVSMFVIFSGGALFGVAGMILAYPVAGSVKVILAKLLKVTSSPTVDALALPVVPLRHRTASEV